VSATAPALRVVSLVPSVTETLLAWGITPLACTRFCEQPQLPHVGGTKDPDISAIATLSPDLVVVCDEENRVEDADSLMALGLEVHSCSPRRVGEVGPDLVVLADAVGASPPLDRMGGPVPELPALGLRAFVPIWRRPWMSFSADTYGSSLLATIGVTNVVDRPGDRYPQVGLDEVAALEPDLVLAPSEPYSFRPAHLADLARVAPVVEVDGQDLFWWGVRTPAAARRLHQAITRVAAD
jgi:ABC-type Fe3+-hydroxamate transport system substrate-binding protein